MGAYFVRRVVGGAVSLVLIMFLGFTFLVEGPLRIKMSLTDDATGDYAVWPRDCSREPFMEVICQQYYLDNPWPLNYVDWWLDPQTPNYELFSSILARSIEAGDYAEMAWTQWRQYAYAAGVLTGYLGVSSNWHSDWMGQPVSRLIGDGWWLLHLFMLMLILALMVVAIRQRRGKAPAYVVSHKPLANVRDDSFRLLGRALAS
jgi:hypothetical protein